MIIAIDIETKQGLRAQPDNFLLGVVVKEGVKKPYIFRKPEDMWEFILNLGRSLNLQNRRLFVYSANHRFDWTLYAPIKHPQLTQISQNMFLYHISETDEEFEARKNNMKRLKKSIPLKKRAYITFLDIFSIYNSSIRTTKSAGLKRIGELIGMQKYDTPEYLKKDSLSIEETKKLKFTQSQIDEITKYCVQDAKIVLKAYEKIKETLKNEGISLQVLYTIHQIAINRFLYKLKCFKSGLITQNKVNYVYELPKPKYPCVVFNGGSGRFHSRFARGGIVQAYQSGTFDNTFKIDCNGFWQYALSTMDIPNLYTEHKIDKPLKYIKKRELLRKIGYCYAFVKVPDIAIGVLPVRVKQDDRIINIFPNNESYIVGHYTLNELMYAEQVGYDVRYIDYVVIWDKYENDEFSKIVNETYNLRKNSKTEFDNWFYKQMGNSFVGKFAQCMPNREILNIPFSEIDKYRAMDYYVVDQHETFYTVEKTLKLRQRAYYAPILYALVTSHARVLHHKAMMKFNPNNILYVDTDSIILKDTSENMIRNRINISDKLGDWKFENKWINGFVVPEKAVIYKEKYYEFGDEMHMSGISLKSMEDFKQERNKNPNLDTIIRQRLITKNMVKDVALIGTMKVEEIKLTNKKITVQRKIYIDELYEDRDSMNEQIFKVVHAKVNKSSVKATEQVSVNGFANK